MLTPCANMTTRPSVLFSPPSSLFAQDVKLAEITTNMRGGAVGGLHLFPSLFFGLQAGLTVESILASWLQFHEDKKRGVIH
jgi:hypothetical protein